MGLELLDPGDILLEALQALLPHLGGLFGVDRHVFPLRLGLVLHPGLEVLGAKSLEGQAEIAHVPLGIDDDGGDVVDGRLFDKVDPQAGLPAARHADDGGVGGEVFRFHQGQDVARLEICLVDVLPQVKKSQFFKDIAHKPSPYDSNSHVFS